MHKLDRIVVYSNYSPKYRQGSLLQVNWNVSKNQFISQNECLGFFNNNEGVKIELMAAYDGEIIYLNESEFSSKTSSLLYRIKMCSHFWGDGIFCEFCQDEVLNSHLEYLYYYPLVKDETLKITAFHKKTNFYYRESEEICSFIFSDFSDLLTFKMPLIGKLVWKTPTLIQSSFTYQEGLFTIKFCYHDELFMNLCTSCGFQLEIRESNTNVHAMISNELKILSDRRKLQMVEKIKSDLHSKRHLLLILDLDNTLIHAMKISNSASEKLKQEKREDLKLIYLHEDEQYVVKIRPYVRFFFEKTKYGYSFKIYTMGVRAYAEKVLMILNEELADIGVKLQREDVISRDENFNPRFKSISRLIPLCNDLVLIIDDRKDVWERDDQKNLILTQPFHYFYYDNWNQGLSAGLLIENGQEDDLFKGRKKSDSYLFFIAHLLSRISNIFYRLRDMHIEADVREIYKDINKNLFFGIKVTFSRLIPKIMNFNEDQYVNIIRKYGGQATDELTNDTDCVITGDYNPPTSKIATANKQGIPVVHYDWIDYCILFHTSLSLSSFILSPSSPSISREEEEKQMVCTNEGNMEKTNEDERILEAIRNKRKGGNSGEEEKKEKKRERTENKRPEEEQQSREERENMQDDKEMWSEEKRKIKEDNEEEEWMKQQNKNDELNEEELSDLPKKKLKKE